MNSGSVGLLLAAFLISATRQSAVVRRSVDPPIAPWLSPIPRGSPDIKPDQVNIGAGIKLGQIWSTSRSKVSPRLVPGYWPSKWNWWLGTTMPQKTN